MPFSSSRPIGRRRRANRERPCGSLARPSISRPFALTSLLSSSYTLPPPGHSQSATPPQAAHDNQGEHGDTSGNCPLPLNSTSSPHPTPTRFCLAKIHGSAHIPPPTTSTSSSPAKSHTLRSPPQTASCRSRSIFPEREKCTISRSFLKYFLTTEYSEYTEK